MWVSRNTSSSLCLFEFLTHMAEVDDLSIGL